MRILSNFHTHSTFCDGKNTPEEMVERAKQLGFTSLGFTSHAFSPDGEDWCLPREKELEYKNEIERLIYINRKEIDVFLGLEVDVFSYETSFKPQYVIGSSHYVKCGDEFCGVDISSDVTEDTVKRHFGGDWYKFAEAYYETAAKAAEITQCDIVGHLDLVTKFNDGGKYFDENDLRYRTAAIDALRYEAEKCNVFEINTGAISRGYRKNPYPAPFLLKEMKALGCEIVINSDAHSVEGLNCGFDIASQIAIECGFKYHLVLKGDKFERLPL